MRRLINSGRLNQDDQAVAAWVMTDLERASAVSLAADMPEVSRDGRPDVRNAWATLGGRRTEDRHRYEALLRDWGGELPGPHVVFGDVLNPYLIRLLSASESADQHAAVLRRIFALLERMARHDDVLVQEVVVATVCERVGSDPAALAAGRRYMGEATRRLSEDVEVFWGTADSSDASRGPAAVAGSGRIRNSPSRQG